MGTNWARSFGSVRQLRSGRFQARYTAPDGNRYKAEDTFPDELAAFGWLAEVRRSIDLGTWTPPQDKPVPSRIPTVEEFVHHWLEVQAPNIRASTLNTYTEVLSSRVLCHEGLCKTAVDQLTPKKVASWWQDTVTANAGTAHRNTKAYQKLRSVMQLAVEYGYITHNPVYVRAATKRSKPHRKELPTTSELRAILDEVPHRYRLITVLCLFHGLRIGEALALRGQDLSPSNVRVRGTLSRVPNGAGGMKMVLHPPKTTAGYRTVPVLREFRNVIIDHVRTYNPGADEFATVTDKGSAIFDTSYRSIFNRAKDKAGVSTEITPHYGRVYLITRLAEAGATPSEIGRILGQEDTATIVNTYMRAREHRPQELMNNLNLSD
ncbi:hypothetical protein A4R63_08170 [Corynebacterium pseudotuberculosis]|uniref:Tyrosine-type recombinase/integrase n=2 Tax=Corynebacterium pseudotuberculosis TaxID=1719 RepID=A0AAU8RYS1_CORPS|nr:tyrosine-type recombinase/integrase [Corynebacterium pseudotuberculosis]AJF93876.2 tyrosine-type recombinase/integrase [Corynebacterium pseudotuberculosis 258]AKN59723.2 tyrosine-type recombinase/integrase [Corynebacterium pseudotuberculosis 31]APB11446.1 hypothetical protein A4R72_08405 [Corynebacterium pseudotuberculosis]APB13490.1 hypothetical protein A4R71_08420 [Corynebacterium pseudotuberculosis]APB15533.1 hypothetical protein A4R68_08420 [Corynebacterium pseudotuberculosis]